ncbi:flagellar biosynthesis protein FlhF [Motiliproteus coralliicola]|uniref:Flagellar biosynthesis protein FlhF n=1 Tax=Motiliproteus coralliicola TaxID=2283196 RepID=A0A369WPC9_9GAMM|nr:flagellar biosynthesis protein FlhF [Motiliproteus coralliicola]RDE22426.1 flagellar biosynthesis protein FlhF [Motiliproteus coralliicola]
MKVRRFFAPDMGQAMRLVRDEVGPDAVILSNNRVAGGVEVVVALEYEPAATEPVAPKSLSEARRERQLSALTGGRSGNEAGRRLSQELDRTRTELARRKAAQVSGVSSVRPIQNRQLDSLDDKAWDDVLASLRADQADVDPVPVQKPAAPERPVVSEAVAPRESEVLRAMRSEIEDLKQMLREQMAAPAPASVEAAEDPVLARLRSRLQRVGVSETLIDRLAQALEPGVDLERAWKVSLSRMVESLPVVGEDLVDRGGILAFVGATGVGKTTTIGKLAARYVLKHGSSGVALITTDSYRIAAHEQLRTFGRILDIPVRVVDEEHSLDDALRSLRDRRVVLIDTAGIGGSDQQREAQLEMLAQSGSRIKKLLVLPCTAQQQVLQRSYDHFKSIGLNGAVLSKLDESVSLGEVISTIIEQRLPLAYLADGQRIPDHIEVAKAKTLISRAVVLASGRATVQRDDSLMLQPQHSDAV